MEEAPQIANHTHISLALQTNLSRSSAYVLSLCEDKTNTLEQELLMLLNSKFTCNEIKRLIKNTAYVTDTLGTVFNDMGLFRVFNIVKRISDSYSNICTRVVQTLEKTKLNEKAQKIIEKQQQTQKQNDVVGEELQSIEQAKRKMKLHKLKGISLYDQNYKRKIDKEIQSQVSEQAKKLKQMRQKQDNLNEKQFKMRLFSKLKDQLKQVEEDLYSPSTDQISTFLVFERKFLETFNHTSHEQSVQIILNYLENSQLSAVELLKNTEDMTEEVSKFKMEIEMLVKDVKHKNKERNQNISDKLATTLMRFARRKAEALKKTKIELEKYKKIVNDKQRTKVSIGIQTHLKELGTLKGYEKKINQMEEKYQTRQQQREKAFKTLLSRADQENNTLYTQLTKQKVNYKMATQEAQQIKKQNQKFIEMLYEKKSQKKIQKSKTKANVKSAIESPKQNKSKILIKQQKYDDDEKRGSFVRKDKKISVRLSNNFSKFGDKMEQIGQDNDVGRVKQKKYVSIAQIQNDSRTMTRVGKRNQRNSDQESHEYSFSNYASSLNIRSHDKLKGLTVNSMCKLKIADQPETNCKPKSAFNLNDNQNNRSDQRKIQKAMYLKPSNDQTQKKDLVYRYANSKKRIDLSDEKKMQLKKQSRLKNQNSIGKMRISAFLAKKSQLQANQDKSYMNLPVKTEQNESQQSILVKNKDQDSLLKANKKLKDSNANQQIIKKFQKHEKKQTKSLHQKTLNSPITKHQNTKGNHSNSNSRLPSVKKSKVSELLKHHQYKNSPISKLYKASKPTQQSSLSVLKGAFVSLQYTQAYSISMNQGQVIQFYEPVNQKPTSEHRKELNKMLKYRNKYLIDHLNSENIETVHRSQQLDHHSITLDKQTLKQLKLYNKLCNKRQFLGNNAKSVHEQIKKMTFKQANLIKFDNQKERSLSNQEKSYEDDNINQIFKIKSLTRDGKLIQYHPESKQNFSLHKKILHQIQAQWLKNRNHQKQNIIFNIKQESIHNSITRCKTKYIPSEGLRKVRRKQEFSSIYKKMQYRDPISVAVPLGLPQIKAKAL